MSSKQRLDNVTIHVTIHVKQTNGWSDEKHLASSEVSEKGLVVSLDEVGADIERIVADAKHRAMRKLERTRNIVLLEQANSVAIEGGE